MKIVSVIPLKKGLQKSDLTYFTILDVKLGDIVLVPIKNKKILALVTSVEELKEAKSDIKKANFGLKKILQNKGESIFLKEFLDSVTDIAKYFVQNEGSCLATLIPNIFLENYEKISQNYGFKISKNKNYDDEKRIRSEKLLFQYRTEDRIAIYKTLIRESFARDNSIIIVLPTQLDIEKFSDGLSRGIEQFIFSVHSGISSKKIMTIYEKIMTSSHPVLILCTPSFLSIPRRNIGTVILEHESSNAYRTIAKPHLDLRTFVEIYAAKIKAKYIMADDILRFETIERKDSEGLTPLHPLSFRTDFPGEVEILAKKTRKDGTFQILQDECVDEMRAALNNKSNVFIFSLRKGLATLTVCRDCGETVNCDRCGSPLVLYFSQKDKKRMFVCNRCEREIDSDIFCASCGSWNLIPIGIGTDTVVEEVKRIFPKVIIYKLDRESAKTSSGAKKIIAEFEKSEGSILIGTEMAFHYLKKKIYLSIIASFDSLWSIPNYKMGEKIIQIIFSIIKTTTQRIIIHTKNTEDETLIAVRSGNLSSLVREELESRKSMNYPPFKRFIKISFWGDKEQTVKARDYLTKNLNDYSPEIFSGFLTSRKGEYVTNCLIKLEKNCWSVSDLMEKSTIDTELYSKLSVLPQSFEVFVDPEDLL